MTGILVAAAFFPIKEACGGRGVCSTGPMRVGDKTQACTFYEIKPAALVLLDSFRIKIPFYYSRFDECFEVQ